MLANGPARVVGVDIGGTKISAVLLDERGEIIGRGAQTAPARDGGDAMADAAAEMPTDDIAVLAVRRAG